VRPIRNITIALLLYWPPVGLAPAAQTVTQPFLGVSLYHETKTAPRAITLNVAVIDLSAPGISFLVTPRGPTPQPVFNGVADETIIQTPRAFLNATGAQLAVNASFFAISAEHTVNGKTWTNDLGLTASKGDAYSPWEPPPRTDNNYDDALNISASNVASFVKMPANIVTGYETSPSVSLYNTITGKNRILTGGAVVAPATCGSFCDPNPRTAAGLSLGNSKLILMTVDGRDEGVSDGASLVELAGFMAEYGATNAINLDGGGSTQMAANYYNDGQNAKLVNVPSETERSVGTNLALFALPNGDYNLNGAVDAGDYTVWRKSVGGQLGYDAWRSRYGAAGGSGSEFNESLTIPEPAGTTLASLALLAAAMYRNRTRRTHQGVVSSRTLAPWTDPRLVPAGAWTTNSFAAGPMVAIFNSPSRVAVMSSTWSCK
jgi:exopolysaccharide biosynthesis protein